MNNNDIITSIKKFQPIITSVISSGSLSVEDDIAYCLSEASTLFVNLKKLSESNGYSYSENQMLDLCVGLISSEWSSNGYLSVDWSSIINDLDLPDADITNSDYSGYFVSFAKLITVVNKSSVPCNRSDAVEAFNVIIKSSSSSVIDHFTNSDLNGVSTEGVVNSVHESACILLSDIWVRLSVEFDNTVNSLPADNKESYILSNSGAVFIRNVNEEFVTVFDSFYLCITKMTE